MTTYTFIHIDGDFLLWDKIDLNHDVIFQNLEIGLDFYKDSYEEFYKDEKMRNCSTFSNCLLENYHEKAANLGIFGGNNVDFIKQYAKDVMEFILLNKDNKQILNKSRNSNCFLEQYYLYYLCRANNIKYRTIHSDFYADPKKNRKMQFNIPNETNAFNHFLGDSKKLEIINDYVKSKLHKYYPYYYDVIKNELPKNTHECYYFNKGNSSLDIDGVVEDLFNRMQENKLKLSDNLTQEFRDYLDYKLNILEKSNNKGTQNLSDYDSYSMSNHTDLLVKLSSNFIEIKKYSLPWNFLFFSNDFFHDDIPTSGQIKEITKSNLTKDPVYCAFSLTPFETSVSSLWMTNSHAYIVSRVLSREFQPISNVIIQIQKLLKTKNDDDFIRIQSLTYDFFKKISYYGIIEFKKKN